LKKLLAVFLLTPTIALGGVVASMPNQAGGKIVLTDEACVYRGKNYTNLYKSYFYTTTGATGDGCWAIEDGSETVTVIWHDTGDTKRYPAQNFDIRRR
jgi:hypothetical protein